MPKLRAVAPESEAAALGGRLCACPDGELLQDRRDVVLDGAPGENEAVCDLGVREALTEENEHLELSVGQIGGVAAGRGPRAARQPANSLIA